MTTRTMLIGGCMRQELARRHRLFAGALFAVITVLHQAGGSRLRCLRRIRLATAPKPPITRFAGHERSGGRRPAEAHH
jgi:hypothetical protein